MIAVPSKKVPFAVDDAQPEPPRLVTTTLGVWDVVQEAEPWIRLPGSQLRAAFIEVRAALPYLTRFVCDIWRLGPTLLLVHVLTHVWASVEGTVALYYSSRLLDVMQARLAGHDVRGETLLRAVAARLLCTVLSIAISHAASNHKAVLRDRVKFHFMERSMHAALKIDLPTAQDPEVSNKLPDPWSFDQPGEAWHAVECLMSKVSGALDIVSQAAFLVSIVRQQSAGAGFVIACVAQPFLSFLAESDIWKTSYVYFSNNPHYRHMKALYNLACDRRFQRDLLTNGMDEYIKKEFHTARVSLGDTCTDSMSAQWRAQRPLLGRIITGVGLEFPLVLFALRSFYAPAHFSPGSLAILQQTAQSIRFSITSILYDSSSVRALLTSVRMLYALEEVTPRVPDGAASYPPPGADPAGLEVEFRGVSFAYPGAARDALRDVSFTIRAGQLAVVVGVNGSGKSSLVRLFARLYDPTRGAIRVDGCPLRAFRLAELRRACAVLCQDHVPLPLPLADNIALGRPAAAAAATGAARGRAGSVDAGGRCGVLREEVACAARLGGAHAFIEKLPAGLDTTLDPVQTAFGHFTDRKHKALRALLERQDVPTAISGGESQRLAASRTFMRMGGGGIRFLVVDEPTSALDPEGEYEMFQRLRACRQGKTVVFITHRFGHLTKHADIILCMKDGCLVEQGTHDELIAKRGEYYRLHDIQAQAFVVPPSTQSN